MIGGRLEEMWNTFKEIAIQKAEKVCGMKKIQKNRTSGSKWWNEEVKSKRKEKKKV